MNWLNSRIKKWINSLNMIIFIEKLFNLNQEISAHKSELDWEILKITLK